MVSPLNFLQDFSLIGRIEFDTNDIQLGSLEEKFMLTIEKLNEFGVDTKEGLTRCMNNQKFYFRMISMGLSNDSFEKLGEALKENKLDEAFEAAHALKGVLGNLALTPIYLPLSDMTEMLRAKEDADYVKMYEPIMKLRNELLAMI